ncbi:hypothetical protein BMS3Bbin14_00656 [bacterium BMS3Bbin14]|nr:hypothetical protein BMS3Abin13_00424 [bacterium BMS3Abin13]GBE52194.1 hypothetical protein BMS3Bbin14_00656 [bacterium BMS3Bbin14]HDO29892.1 DUF2339 domain-containing protein [Desulfobacteraceae bacterium]
MNHDKGETGAVAERLSKQLQALATRVEQLSERVSNLESSRATITGRPAGSRIPAARQQPSLKLAGRPSTLINTGILSRIATICFLLVIALILRTITDNHIVNTHIGSLLGITYAVLLIVTGWRLYEKESRLAPVFPGCGILLLFLVVLETHIRFGSPSSIWAYTIIFIASTFVFAMSLRYKASFLIYLAVPGAATIAMAIDFPSPAYPILGAFLLAANIAASYAFKRRARYGYLRGFTLVISVSFWLLWASKIDTIYSYYANRSINELYPAWFFVMLFLFWGVYVTTVILEVIKKEPQLDFFESFLPTLSAAGAFWAGHTVPAAWFGDGRWFDVTVVIIAAGHLALAWWLAGHDRERARGSNVFALAGTCLIVLTSATVIRDIGLVLPVWSAGACVLVLLSAKWHNEGIRITSYLLQLTACIVAIMSGAMTVPSSLPLSGGLAAAGLACFSLLQYRWSRIHKPVPTYSFYFSKIDKNDHSAVILLLIGLLNVFYFAQFGLYEIFSRVTTDWRPSLQSGQSLTINLSAIVLMFIALQEKDKEIIVVAAAVALIGMTKVFVFDMFSIKGVPLVLSVFSSGAVAAVGSVITGRWQKKETT